jgi:solute carrier family 1 (glial high affinity glutamate transporter), member 2
MFPDNIFQAAFQSAYTSYVPKSQNLELNDTEEISQKFLSVNANPANPQLREQQELIRVVQYRSGTNTLGIVIFCLIFGTILGTIGEKGQVVVSFFSAVFLTCLWLSPFGISSVIAGKILDVENLSLIISQLLMFIITVASGVFIYQLIVLQIIYFAIVKKNPYKFYAGLFQPMLYSFATASKYITIKNYFLFPFSLLC